MLLIPLPLMIAEFLIFFFAVKQWGFFNTLGLYLLPCLLGFFIVSTVGRMAMMTLQSTVMRGQIPTGRILHSGAIFLSGLLLLVPSFFTRVVGLILLLPGLRHLAVWRFKLYMAQKVAKGVSGFNFGGQGQGKGPFGFSGGSGGFRYYGFGNAPGGFPQEPAERDVSNSHDVLDVTPLKVTHEVKIEDPKKNSQEEE